MDQLTLLIFLLTARDYVLSLVKATLDLGQFRPLKADLDNPLAHMILAIDHEDNLFVTPQDESLDRNGQYVLDMPKLQLGIGVHPRVDGKVFIGDIDLGFHGSGFEIHAAGKADDLAR